MPEDSLNSIIDDFAKSYGKWFFSQRSPIAEYISKAPLTESNPTLPAVSPEV